MMLWRSVVGKLWITIIFLVSFVLFILTLMLLEFFENYHIDEMKKNLSSTATKVATIFEKYDDTLGQEVSWDLLDEKMGMTIAKTKNEAFHSPVNSRNFSIPISYFLKNKELSQVLIQEKKKTIVTTYHRDLKGSNKEIKMVMIGIPFHSKTGETGAVYVYQPFEEETTRSTTKFIFLAAGVAIVLTTIFAFFLLSRITSPLRKMREAAFAVARGKFDTKVPILTHDEIGELATAFNQMGRQLKFNMNALSQEKEKLSSILSGMADGVITFSRDGTILITNPPAERFLHYWYYEQDRTHQNTEAIPSQVMDLFQLALSTEDEQVGEISLQGRFWVVIVSPLYNNTYIRGAVAVIRDMTEERKLDKLRNDFIANVSHELRTPISMLQGYSEAIVDDIAGTDEEKKEMASIIYDESLRMGRLVNELLDLARMEAGHKHLNIEEVELHPYIQRIIRKFQGLVKEKEIMLHVEYKCENDIFFFDPDRMEQVLTNLIDNAIRHISSGGSIQVTVTEDGRGLSIEVSDTGEGISEEDLPFVFERFYKADKARTRGRSGTGLGLAIAKNIIEAHKGNIDVQSKLGHGTTFTFFLPRMKG
ncbi:ATP-binding protein [Bacillus sp. 03113]|uniref:ATP-binding protein n=1 Tax=Bacillus sp. 03113 TaxID=2578211 RepID=UPI001144F007|nr:ATP-binding protein [Bacillus sp. 03113]